MTASAAHGTWATFFAEKNRAAGYDLGSYGGQQRLTDALGVSASVISNWRKKAPDPAGCRKLTAFWGLHGVGVDEIEVFRAAGHLSQPTGRAKPRPALKPKLSPELQRLLEVLEDPRLSARTRTRLERQIADIVEAAREAG